MLKRNSNPWSQRTNVLLYFTKFSIFAQLVIEVAFCIDWHFITLHTSSFECGLLRINFDNNCQFMYII
jgi:hypothetical protein